MLETRRFTGDNTLPESVASVIEKLPGSSAMWNVRNTDSYK